jgi:gas vesicle protein
MEDIIQNIQKLDGPKIDALSTLVAILGNAEIIDELDRSFGGYTNVPINILNQIYKNQKLFKAGSHICQRLVLNLDQAVLMKKRDDVLLHFGNIDIYAVMTPDEYKEFGKYSRKNDIYQIILLSEKQKIILLHDLDQNFVNELVDVAKKATKYELQVRNDKNQLEIKNKIADNYNESKEIYDELTQALYRKYKNIREILKLIEPELNGYTNRILKLLVSGSKFGNIDELGTIIVVNNNYTTEIGTNNGFVNSGSGKGVNKVITKTKNLIKKWMEDNPPEEPTSIKQMQEKCKNNTGIDVKNITMGKILREIYPEIKSKRMNGTNYYFI